MKRSIVPLFLVAAAAVAALLGLELLLRAAGYSAPGWYRPDPQLGWALRPGRSGWFTSEGRSFVQINSTGQRDREHSLSKPQDVYRIAVLGDAFSEGMQVALEETYWAMLPEQLASCGFQPGKRVEVLNFGVRGYGTAQAYLMLKTTAVRYRPDLVLLQFSNGNDVRDNSYALDPKREERPFFVLDETGRLQLDDSFASAGAYARRASFSRKVLRNLAEHSRVLQLARGLRNVELVERVHAGSAANETGLETEVLAAPREAPWKEAWRITEGLILEMGDLAMRNGARLAVVTVPYAAHVHPDAAQRAALMARYGVADLAYPERRVASFAEQNGILAIMLGAEMQAIAAAARSSLYGFENAKPGFGHWNELGHRAAAAIIAQQLCARSF
jgi:hypothetical protein